VKATVCLVAFVAVAVSGCGALVRGDASPQSSGTFSGPVTWHPCEGIPRQGLAAAQIAESEPEHQDHTNPTSNNCNYQAKAPSGHYYGVGIAARENTLEEIGKDKRYTPLEKMTLGGHAAVVSDFWWAKQCFVSVEIAPGVLEFAVGYSPLDPFHTPQEACVRTKEIAQLMVPHFPEHL
jgi:hypothetical protein